MDWNKKQKKNDCNLEVEIFFWFIICAVEDVDKANPNNAFKFLNLHRNNELRSNVIIHKSL